MRNLSLAFGLTLAVALTAGCDDPSKSAPAAKVAPAAATPSSAPAAAKPAAAKPAPSSAPAAAPAAAPAGGTKLAITPANSKVQFTGSKVTGKHDGAFHQFSGSLMLDAAAPEKSSVTIDIDTASVKTDSPKLDGHLKSPDFFDVAKFPKATFVSKSIAATTAGGTHTITGDLSLHGVTKSISFPATIGVTPAAVAVKADFSINRKDFQIVYPGMPDDLIRDGVVIRLDLNLPRS